PCAVLFLVLKETGKITGPPGMEMIVDLAINLLAFFSTALMCHGELAKDRPSTKHLTEFYFWMSLGGVLGGLFNALFAPIGFQSGLGESMVAIAFACLLRSSLVEDVKTLIPFDSNAERTRPFGIALDICVPIGIGLLGYYFIYAGDRYQGTVSYELT